MLYYRRWIFEMFCDELPGVTSPICWNAIESPGLSITSTSGLITDMPSGSGVFYCRGHCIQ